jgi:hypothetical protein
MQKSALTKSERELKEAMEQAMTFASRRMIVLEQLASKNPEYRQGFFDGMAHESDFVIALLSPTIEGLKQSIDQALRAQRIES